MSELPLLSPDAESRRLWILRIALGRSIAADAFRRGRLRLGLIVFLTVLLWGFVYLLFREGFGLIWQTINHAGTRIQIAHAIFNVFFLALTLMLAFSSAIIMYGALYRSKESLLLLTLPIRRERVVLYKFQETVFVACWGFLLIGSPLLLAYGEVAGAPWYYFPLLLPFMVTFVSIPCAVGAMLCMFIVRYLPRARKNVVWATSACMILLLLGVAAFAVRSATADNLMNVQWFQTMINRLEYCQRRVLPSWWLSTGLLEAAHPADDMTRHAWTESLGFLSLLASHAMLLYLLVGALGRAWYAQGVSELAGMGGQRKTSRRAIADQMVWAATGLLPPRMRHLLLKDFRVFRRDTLQWSQLAIFIALLVLYFLNMQRWQSSAGQQTWLIMVGFLNVAVVALLLATFTTRFIYPLISLEGRKLWVLGTLPMRRSWVLWSKFIFALGVAVLPCGLLVLLSDLMLGMFSSSPLLVLVHQALCFTLCVGLCAIAVGLGARLPSLPRIEPGQDCIRIRWDTLFGHRRPVHHDRDSVGRRSCLLLGLGTIWSTPHGSLRVGGTATGTGYVVDDRCRSGSGHRIDDRGKPDRFRQWHQSLSSTQFLEHLALENPRVEHRWLGIRQPGANGRLSDSPNSAP